jgi:hypothetical protein
MAPKKKEFRSSLHHSSPRLQQSQGTWPSADGADGAAGDGGVEGDDIGLNLVEPLAKLVNKTRNPEY